MASDMSEKHQIQISVPWFCKHKPFFYSTSFIKILWLHLDNFSIIFRLNYHIIFCDNDAEVKMKGVVDLKINWSLIKSIPGCPFLTKLFLSWLPKIGDRHATKPGNPLAVIDFVRLGNTVMWGLYLDLFCYEQLHHGAVTGAWFPKPVLYHTAFS